MNQSQKVSLLQIRSETFNILFKIIRANSKNMH